MNHFIYHFHLFEKKAPDFIKNDLLSKVKSISCGFDKSILNIYGLECVYISLLECNDTLSESILEKNWRLLNEVWSCLKNFPVKKREDPFIQKQINGSGSKTEKLRHLIKHCKKKESFTEEVFIYIKDLLPVMFFSLNEFNTI